MYNLTAPYCRVLLVQRNVEGILSQRLDWGANLAYDGINRNRLDGKISWLSEDIDSDLDGVADDPQVLDAAYQAGVEDSSRRGARTASSCHLNAQRSGEAFTPWINGKLFEWQLSNILETNKTSNWDELIPEYRRMVHLGQTPHTTFIESLRMIFIFSRNMPIGIGIRYHLPWKPRLCQLRPDAFWPGQRLDGRWSVLLRHNFQYARHIVVVR